MSRSSRPPVTTQRTQANQLEKTVADACRALALARVDESRKHIKSLQTLMPGHAVLAHLERQLVAIGFEWPLARSGYVPGCQPAPDPCEVELVAFHANMPATPSGIHVQIDYLDVLALSFESAALRAPRARRILLTDEHTPVPPALKIDEVIRFPIDLERLMYERMRVQSLYLEQRRADRVSVLLDSDVVINREPSTIFAETFDVGLTWRPEFADAPFNGGVIFIGKGNGGAAFFHRTLTCYNALAASTAVSAFFPRDLRAWWGDQFAIAATVGYHAYATRQTDGIEVDGLRARLFPCSEYNFTIEPNSNYPGDVLGRKYFVHFKGNRKALQAQYLEYMRGNPA